MARGKNAVKVNAALREELRQATDRERKQQARIAKLEAERDQAMAKLSAIDQAEHPAIEAERARADAAKAAAAALRSEICATARQVIELLVKDEMTVAEAETARAGLNSLGLSDLFGAVWNIPEADRNARRAVTDGSPGTTREMLGPAVDIENLQTQGLSVKEIAEHLELTPPAVLDVLREQRASRQTIGMAAGTTTGKLP